MTSLAGTASPVRGRIDRDGCLIEADPLLADLHARAGGVERGHLAVPQLASLARLARRLRIVIARGVVAGDGEQDIGLWVRIAPTDDGGAEIAIVRWDEAPAPGPQPDGADRRAHDFARAEADWNWGCDEQLRLTELSPEAAAAVGTTPARLRGAALTHLLTLEPDPAGSLPLLEAMGHARDFAGQPARLRESDGRAVTLAGEVLVDEEGRFAGFRGTARWVAADDEALPSAFGGVIGDALREPLDRIIAAAEAIRTERDGPVRANYVEYAGDIASAGRHLRALVGDLVDLQAVESPGFKPLVERVDLAACARQAAALLAARAEERQVRIVVTGEEAAVEGEGRRILQILVNLVGNAVRYSPEGEAVEVVLDRDRGFVRATVVDRGKGIAPADQARIFDKFERVDPSEPGGTGLGLTIARRLARAMGGDITVTSAPGEGAAFTLGLRPA